MKEEIWKDIKGYEGYYKISSYGNVKSLDRIISNNRGSYLIKGMYLKHKLNNKGYKTVLLSKKGIQKHFYIHRLVYFTFTGSKNNKYLINHIDKNIKNNKITNLEEVTHRGNISHAFKNKNKTSKYTGVYFNKKSNKWEACFKIKRKNNYLGCYENEIDAAKAYNNALEKYGLTNKYKNIIP